MSEKFDFVEGGEAVFTVEVDYNMVGYSNHTRRLLVMTPEAASDLVERLTGALEWYNHPLYKWAVKKTENNV